MYCIESISVVIYFQISSSFCIGVIICVVNICTCGSCNLECYEFLFQL